MFNLQNSLPIKIYIFIFIIFAIFYDKNTSRKTNFIQLPVSSSHQEMGYGVNNWFIFMFYDYKMQSKSNSQNYLWCVSEFVFYSDSYQFCDFQTDYTCVLILLNSGIISDFQGYLYVKEKQNASTKICSVNWILNSFCP